MSRSADTAESNEKALQVAPGSGNVFADLGFEESELELAKAHLSYKIAMEIAARKLTQRAAAEMLSQV